MNGLEVAKRFFAEWGLPRIKSTHPKTAERVAAGLMEGSQTLGADDELSRDHGWGPMFRLWLPSGDYEEIGLSLEKDIRDNLPESFLGYPIRDREDCVTVDSIDGFFRAQTGGFTHPPQGIGKWDFSFTVESQLYFVKHGHVFYDPLGEFTTRRAAFSMWPEDLLLDRRCQTSYKLWHYGEYNFPRVSRRSDPVTILSCTMNFIDAAMRQCFYLNGDFTPYWKWMSHEFRKIEWARPIATQIDALVTADDILQRVELVGGICLADTQQSIREGDHLQSRRGGHG